MDNRQVEKNVALCSDIVENIPIGIVVWRLEDPADEKTFRLVAANPASSKAAGIPLHDYIGKTMPEAFPDLYKTSLPKLYAEVVRSGRDQDVGEIKYGDEHISERVFSIKAFPLPDQCVAIIFENISERKKLEDALEGTLQALFHTKRASRK